jgi:hypothetical protein
MKHASKRFAADLASPALWLCSQGIPRGTARPLLSRASGGMASQKLRRDVFINWVATLSHLFRPVAGRAIATGRTLAASMAIFVVTVCCAPSAMAMPVSGFPSGYAVAGTTVDGVTSFGPVNQIAAGVDTYVMLDTGPGRCNCNRWGDYSATTLDPITNNFWTIQEYASAKNVWSTKIAEVSVDAGSNKLSPVTSFTGSSISNGGGNPPDTMGAVGPNHFVELLNGVYAVYDKAGNLAAPGRLSLNQFWTNAAVNPTNGSFDPRILYDASSQRWFASSLDNQQNPNNLLVAVSNSSDPTMGWKGFSFQANPQYAGTTNWADFDTVGINANGLFL